MFKTALRFLLLRVLPRRLIPIVTIVEVLLLLRSVRRRAGVRINPPAASRTAPPVPLEGRPDTTDTSTAGETIPSPAPASGG
jgi:hypothetical protein